MNLTLTTEQNNFQSQWRSFCQAHIIPFAQTVDEEGRLSPEHWRKLGEAGYLGLRYPAEYGGPTERRDVVHYVLAAEELAKACPSTYLAVVASTSLCGGTILRYGSEAQKRAYLPRLARGEIVGAFALNEPEAGSDWRAVATTARRDDSGYVLTGTKSFVTNGPLSAVAVVLARDDAAPEGQASLFILDREWDHYQTGQPMATLGVRGSSISDLVLTDCAVPSAGLLGPEGLGVTQVEEILKLAQLDMAIFSLGIAQACLEEAYAHAAARQQFGSALISFQEVSFKLADIKMLSDTARILIHKAAWAQSEGLSSAAVDLDIARLFASQAARVSSDMALQICGGHGYLAGSRVERLYRDAKLGELWQPTPELQRQMIAEDVLAHV